MATTTKATKPTAPKARTCTWKPDGEKRCGKPTVRPAAVTCREHVKPWMDAHGRKMTAFSAMTDAEIAKAKAARPKPATKAPSAKDPKVTKATKPTPRKVPAKASAEDAGTTMEKEVAAVKEAATTEK